MTININFDTGSTSKEELQGLAALIGHVVPVAMPMAELRDYQRNLYSGSNAIGYGAKTPLPGPRDPEGNAPTDDAPTDEAPSTQTIPTTVMPRERGKPAPGRARRTREEIAEDEAADKADAASGTTQSISTGGERVGPEDDEATQAQDRADELAEEGKTEEPAMTMEQAVMAGKAAIGDYVKKFGMAAAQEDGMSVFIGALGDVPAGAKGWGWSMLAESGNLAGAIKAAKAWQAAAAAAGRFGA